MRRSSPESLAKDLKPFASLLARMAAYNSTPTDDIAIAFWVGDECLIIQLPSRRTPPNVDLRVVRHPRPVRGGGSIGHAIVPSTCTVLRHPLSRYFPILAILSCSPREGLDVQRDASFAACCMSVRRHPKNVHLETIAYT